MESAGRRDRKARVGAVILEEGPESLKRKWPDLDNEAEVEQAAGDTVTSPAGPGEARKCPTRTHPNCVDQLRGYRHEGLDRHGFTSDDCLAGVCHGGIGQAEEVRSDT